MAEPTDEQLREYAAKLPQLYREIFVAFNWDNPGRREHDPLTIESIITDVLSRSDNYYSDEVLEAVELLIKNNFLRAGELRKMRLVGPTALGERLLTEITGVRAAKRGAPPLPVPTWS